GAEWTMFIQDQRRWFGRVNRDPFMQGFKKRSESFGMMIEFDAVRCPIHPNGSSRTRRRVLEAFQHIADKGQRQLLLFADAVRPYEDRGFVAIFPERRGLFHSGQDTTICCKPVHLELSLDQHLAPLAEVL